MDTLLNAVLAGENPALVSQRVQASKPPPDDGPDEMEQGAEQGFGGARAPRSLAALREELAEIETS